MKAIKLIFLVLLFFLHDDTFQQLPMSPSEQVLTHVEGLSISFTISCGFTYGVPIWLINGSVYDLNKVSFPFLELDGIYGIRISSITFCMNGTTFQCLSSQYNLRGSLTTLEVIKNPYNDIRVPCENNSLFQFQRIHNSEIETSTVIIGENFIKLKWIRPPICEDFQFILQVFENLDTISILNTSLPCCENIFTSNILLNQDGSSSFLKLIGTKDNIICNMGSLFYYTFEATPTEQVIIANNNSICFPFPISTSQCNFNSSSLFMSISHDCNIRIHPEINPMKYECYRRLNLFNVTINTTAREVCLSNWNVGPNGRVVWFMCMDRCLPPYCKAIYHFVSSYEVLTDRELSKQVNETENQTTVFNNNISMNYEETPLCTRETHWHATVGILVALLVAAVVIIQILIMVIVFIVSKLRKLYSVIKCGSNPDEVAGHHETRRLEKGPQGTEDIAMITCLAYEKVTNSSKATGEDTAIYETL